MAVSQLVNRFFNIGIRGLRLSGIDHINIVVFLHFSPAALHPVGVKHQDQRFPQIPLVVLHQLDQFIPGGIHIDSGQLPEIVPGKNDIVSVHKEIGFSRGPRSRLSAFSFPVSGVRVRITGVLHRAFFLLRAGFDGTIGSLKNGLQFFFPGGIFLFPFLPGLPVSVCNFLPCLKRIPCISFPVGLLRAGPAGLLPAPACLHMRILRNHVPRYKGSGSVTAENRAGGIFGIGIRIVIFFQNDILRVVAGPVSVRRDGDTSVSVRVGNEFLLVGSVGRRRDTACHRHLRAAAGNRFRLRHLRAPVPVPHIIHQPSGVFRRKLGAKLIHGLQ